MSQPDHVDPLAELVEISAMAQQAILRLRGGHAVNGVSALRKIQARADDAARHGRAQLERVGRHHRDVPA